MSNAIPWILFLATACALVLTVADARGYYAELMRVGGELAKELDRSRQGVMDRCGRCRLGLGLMRAADLNLGGNRLLEALDGKPANG